MRKLNLVFLASLVAAFLVLGGGAYVVRRWQVQRNVSALLARAEREQQQGQSARAVETLKQYVNLRPDDNAGWRTYARLMDETTDAPRRREETYLVYQEALNHNPGDLELQRRSVDLALELRPERTSDARRFLKDLIGHAAEKLEKSQDATKAASAALELAELKELDAKCLLLDADFPAAASEFEEAISYDPSRLFCYVQLARLERGSLGKDPREADREIDWMIAGNPGSGLRSSRAVPLSRGVPPARAGCRSGAGPATGSRGLRCPADSGPGCGAEKGPVRCAGLSREGAEAACREYRLPDRTGRAGDS